MKKRVILIVLDGVGAGALPDAADYGDTGANTLGHIYQIPGFTLPNMENLGLAEIIGKRRENTIKGVWGKALEQSCGKDTTIGHWEIAGLISKKPLPTYPDGFPKPLIKKFEKAIGKRTLGNKAASGTEILEELGQKHKETGFPIVYTSADSVFQIAAHEDVIPVENLYDYCKTARKMLTGIHGVGRVIARPFSGNAGAFVRTDRRHDYSLPPPGITMMDRISEAQMTCSGVGKISDIFLGKGLTSSYPSIGNMNGVDITLHLMDSQKDGLIFTNLVDFDMKYGHRRDVQGFANALSEFDCRLPEVYEKMTGEDMLIITADHGCDPAYAGTDHTREYVPILIFGDRIARDRTVGTRNSFADIAATVTDYFGCKNTENGKSMKKEIEKENTKT